MRNYKSEIQYFAVGFGFGLILYSIVLVLVALAFGK